MRPYLWRLPVLTLCRLRLLERMVALMTDQKRGERHCGPVRCPLQTDLCRLPECVNDNVCHKDQKRFGEVGLGQIERTRRLTDDPIRMLPKEQDVLKAFQPPPQSDLSEALSRGPGRHPGPQPLQ